MCWGPVLYVRLNCSPCGTVQNLRPYMRRCAADSELKTERCGRGLSMQYENCSTQFKLQCKANHHKRMLVVARLLPDASSGVEPISWHNIKHLVRRSPDYRNIFEQGRARHAARTAASCLMLKAAVFRCCMLNDYNICTSEEMSRQHMSTAV